MPNIDFSSIKPLPGGTAPRLFIETYGCQMNVNDSEVVLSIMQEAGWRLCDKLDEADLILVNTCSVRESAETRVMGRLDLFLQHKKGHGAIVGVLGCMAERMKEELLAHPAVDLVAGPDSYRDLPRLAASLSDGDKQINTLLSSEETYADIAPVRMDKGGISAFISIMRGCNNFCTYCIVPFVRGRERSRDKASILAEARALAEAGYKEINLLGQNVDSYRGDDGTGFAALLDEVASAFPGIRIRFATSHPKDMCDDVLHVMAAHENICKHIHLPVQSGSTAMLQRMNRHYSREEYLARVAKIREMMPECAITTDIIAGFCGETLEEHLQTISLMEEVRFDGAFMFQYSERPGTLAAKHFADDVPTAEKTRRLNEIIALQNRISLEKNSALVDSVVRVLIEGPSKRSASELCGRGSDNRTCVFPACGYKAGEMAEVRIKSCTSATLKGEINLA